MGTDICRIDSGLHIQYGLYDWSIRDQSLGAYELNHRADSSNSFRNLVSAVCPRAMTLLADSPERDDWTFDALDGRTIKTQNKPINR
jgi:hypothetical protein